jgi:hypothetical protein
MKRKNDGELLPGLFMELFQTEESAREHPRIEAERLGGSPPGRAVRAVAAHAERVLPELERLAAAEGLATNSFGKWIGDTFSSFRRRAFDQILGREKSYRSTLIGLHHGIDVVRLLRSAARAAGRARIEAFCEGWLAERTPLVAECAKQLDWFGEHPHLALEPARVRLGEKRRTA